MGDRVTELPEFRIDHAEECACTEMLISEECIVRTGAFVEWLNYYSIDGEDLEDLEDKNDD